MEPIVAYIVTGLLGSGLAAAWVAYLTTHPLKMGRYLFVAGALIPCIVFLLVAGTQGSHRWMATGITLALFVGSYLITTKAVLARRDTRPLPELHRKQADPGNGHVAVIYFSHGEPETYDPIGWINQFREFDEQGIPFVPTPARPIFLFELRRAYLRIGRSGHRQMHRRMLESLEARFRDQGDLMTQFYLSFLDDNPRPDAAVIDALNGGASHIVVSEVFTTISNHTAEGKQLVEAVLADYAVPIHYTGPLYDSAMLQSLFVRRANQHLNGLDKTEVGVLLIGHGQPDEWDREWPTETAQEISFRLEALRMLEEDGFMAENIGLAWMAFKEPKPAPRIEEMAARGVKRILYFAASISAEAMHSQYDIPKLVHEAQVPDDVELVNLGAWNDDPIVIAAIKEKIDALGVTGV